MKKTIYRIAFCLLLTSSAFALQDARPLRFPDVNKDLVVFVYAGDIWSVPSAGGSARKLTNHPGRELFPKISPDGKWIAYSAEYSGSRQVYVIPAEGGTPRQLTWYNDAGIMPPRGGYDYVIMDWSADSKQIMVRANRTPWGERMGKYFMVSLAGGLEKPLAIPEAGSGRLSPDNQSVCYTPIEREFRTWKRTQGGRAQDIWIYDLKANSSKRLTDFTGTDQHPLWFKDKICFVSDRDLVLNFYTYDLKSEKIEQLTRFSDYDVLWPSGRFSRVAFEKGGYIFLLDLDSGSTRKLTVDLDFDNPHTLPHFKNVSSHITRFGYTVSPSGKRAAFDGRGDIFTVPAENGHTDNLTGSQGVREFYPAWSPDGKWIACYSDASGDYELVLLDPAGKEKPRTLTRGHKVWKYPALWSPDSQKLLFSDKNQLLQIVDVKTKTLTVVDQADLAEITDYNWSPDSRWVVYTKNGSNNLNTLWVYSLDGSKARQLLNTRYNCFSGSFSLDGRYLYFLSQRDFNWSFSDFEFDYIYNKSTRIYAVSLTKYTPQLLPDKNDIEELRAPEKPAVDQGKGKKDAKEVKPLVIDFAGIDERVMTLPFAAGDYGGVQDLGGNKLLYFGDNAIHLYDLDSRKDETVIKGIDGAAVTANGKKLLYRAGGDYGIIDIKPGQKPGDAKLNLADMTMRIEPLKEWSQIFNEGWRIYRDWFYVKNMHGVDWEQMKRKYEPLVSSIGHRTDLDFLFGEMLGELNVGHTYVNWGDFARVPRIDTGLLGAELEADEAAGRYRIKKIYRSENWNDSTRSPLTEVGIDIREGDCIISLNGSELKIADNPYRLLENTAGRRIEITVNDKPRREGARTYWIKPIRSELALMALDWVESRRQLVDKLSGGRIGYVYVPDTAGAGHREFYKAIIAQTEKEAWIIDERYNGGGYNPAKMVDMLARNLTSYWHGRGVRLQRDPAFALEGPKVMLINHYSSSGGDNFPYLFQTRQLGTLIGTRTWGGLVGYNWSPNLVDGPSFAVPMRGIVGSDGQWTVEGVGIYPDIEVYDRPEEIAKGNDPCIEAAVKHLLEQLRKNPPVKIPENPADPDRSKWFEKEIR
ncbi:acetyl-CoA synthetase [candidate division KSB1 bacterium]|nr:PD40 domain-containing protein [Candidatus Aminicenantes bacterium]RQW03551.1 MAG: acetyl-CoA synthetase [candidate division KSB1 bacterium]